MLRDKIFKAGNYIVKHCAILFPVIVIALAAVTVSAALNANRAREEKENNVQNVENTAVPQNIKTSANSVQEIGELAIDVPAPEEVPMTENTDEEVAALVYSYYNSMATGDIETLTAIHDSLSTADILRFDVTSQFIDGYGACDIYVKRGMTADSVLACVYYRVCFMNHPEEFPGYQMLYLSRDDQGKIYIKNDENFTEEENQYIIKVANQDDVKEFHNRVTNEYNELMLAQPELLDYLGELSGQIDKSVGAELEALGVAMAEQNIGEDGQSEEGDSQEEPDREGAEEASGNSVINVPRYAVATTTVNVRSSDSEKADKLGKVATGIRVQVQEVQINGWTKIVYEGQDGYIKSEFLQMEESADDLNVIGRVTANANINVRVGASSSSERLGLLSGGETLELLAVEDGWCKVIYNGQIGYVSAEYVTQE